MDCLKVSPHAIDRYRERTNCTVRMDACHVKQRLESTFNKSVPAELKKEYRVTQLLRYGLDKTTEYRICSNIVFVIVDGVVATVHRNESKRWSVKR